MSEQKEPVVLVFGGNDAIQSAVVPAVTWGFYRETRELVDSAVSRYICAVVAAGVGGTRGGIHRAIEEKYRYAM